MIVTGAQLQAMVERGAAAALAELARELLDAAVAQVPPPPPIGLDPDVGLTLSRTGKVEVEPGGLGVVVGFNAPYAARVHEQLHAKHKQGGKAKFLEDPLKALMPRFQGVVAGRVHAELR